MRLFSACVVLRGVLCFQVPTAVVVRSRLDELRGSMIDDVQFRRPRPPKPEPEPIGFGDVLVKVPQSAFDGVQIANLALILLVNRGVDVPISVQEAGLIFSGLTFALNVVKTINDPPTPIPESLVRANLKKVFVPPPNATWTGINFGEEQVLDFVNRNPAFETLVLEDPSGTVKKNLLNGLFRGEIHVVDPTMTALSLEEDLSKFFGLKETKGLDDIARWIKNGITFPFGSRLLPAKVIVDLLDVDEPATLRSVVNEVTLLKEKAGDNVVTIITVANDDFITNLPLPTSNTLKVLSEDVT